MKPMSAVTAASRGSLSPGWRGFMTGERGWPGLPSSQLAANFSIAPIHDRMPLVIPAGEGLEWLNDPMAASLLLGREPAALSVRVV